MKDINDMTRKELESTRQRDWNEDIGEFDSLIILPTEDVHDSGFRAMDFVAVRDNIPICRMSGCSDVIHLDGIGGFGKDWNVTDSLPKHVRPKGWSIDCLKVSGLLRIFCSGKLSAGDALSDFNLFGNIRNNNK